MLGATRRRWLTSTVTSPTLEGISSLTALVDGCRGKYSGGVGGSMACPGYTAGAARGGTRDGVGGGEVTGGRLSGRDSEGILATGVES